MGNGPREKEDSPLHGRGCDSDAFWGKSVVNGSQQNRDLTTALCKESSHLS
jgi:hypothetical protein